MAKTGTNIKNYDNSPDMGNVDYVVEWQKPTERNGYTWYRLYASGWIIQGGVTWANHDSQYSFNLPKAMKDSNYNITIGVESTNTSGAGYAYVGIRSKSSTTITLWSNSSYISKKYWVVQGFAM